MYWAKKNKKLVTRCLSLICSVTIFATFFSVVAAASSMSDLPKAGEEGYMSLHRYVSHTDDPNVFRVHLSAKTDAIKLEPPSVGVFFMVDKSGSMTISDEGVGAKGRTGHELSLGLYGEPAQHVQPPGSRFKLAVNGIKIAIDKLFNPAENTSWNKTYVGFGFYGSPMNTAKGYAYHPLWLTGAASDVGNVGTGFTSYVQYWNSRTPGGGAPWATTPDIESRIKRWAPYIQNGMSDYTVKSDLKEWLDATHTSYGNDMLRALPYAYDYLKNANLSTGGKIQEFDKKVLIVLSDGDDNSRGTGASQTLFNAIKSENDSFSYSFFDRVPIAGSTSYTSVQRSITGGAGAEVYAIGYVLDKRYNIDPSSFVGHDPDWASKLGTTYTAIKNGVGPLGNYSLNPTSSSPAWQSEEYLIMAAATYADKSKYDMEFTSDGDNTKPIIAMPVRNKDSLQYFQKNADIVDGKVQSNYYHADNEADINVVLDKIVSRIIIKSSTKDFIATETIKEPFRIVQYRDEPLIKTWNDSKEPGSDAGTANQINGKYVSWEISEFEDKVTYNLQYYISIDSELVFDSESSYDFIEDSSVEYTDMDDVRVKNRFPTAFVKPKLDGETNILKPVEDSDELNLSNAGDLSLSDPDKEEMLMPIYVLPNTTVKSSSNNYKNSIVKPQENLISEENVGEGSVSESLPNTGNSEITVVLVLAVFAITAIIIKTRSKIKY